MTPAVFEANTSAWLIAFSHLVVPITMFIGSVCGIVAYLKGKVTELRVNAHSQTIQDILRDTPAPAQSGGTTVNTGPDGTANVTNTAPPPPTQINPTDAPPPAQGVTDSGKSD